MLKLASSLISTSIIALLSLLSTTPAFGDATTGGTPIEKSPNPGQQTGGAINFWKGIDAKDNPCTSSRTYVDMPNMKLTFTTAGRVIANFQGEWISGSPNNRALLRLVIDGKVQSGPGDNSSPFSPHEGTQISTNGFTFISDTLTSGLHIAKIQWAASAGKVCVDERSFVIYHK